MPRLELHLPVEQLIACHECDLLIRKPVLKPGENVRCPRCAYEIDVYRPNLVMRSLALAVTALLLYVPANFLPLMHLHLLGQSSDETVWGAVRGLYDTGMHGVAVVVFLCSMAIPLLKLICQLVVLLSIQLTLGRRYGLWLYRLYHHLREWGMLEVYFMGMLVAMIKLVDLAELRLGLGLAYFIALLFVQIWLEVMMSPQRIWSALSGEDLHEGD